MKWQKGEREDARDSIAIQVRRGDSNESSYVFPSKNSMNRLLKRAIRRLVRKGSGLAWYSVARSLCRRLLTGFVLRVPTHTIR